MGPGHKARKNPSDNADMGFQAVGSSLRIMQLNVEGLSAAKRHIIESLAEIHHINVICLQETRVNDDKSDRLTISGFDIISYTLFIFFAYEKYSIETIPVPGTVSEIFSVKE